VKLFIEGNIYIIQNGTEGDSAKQELRNMLDGWGSMANPGKPGVDNEEK